MCSDLVTSIITSPTARRMLNMVTDDFYSRSFIGLWMFEVIGREYDDMAKWSRDLKLEIFPQTCTWSIAIWEWVYGIESNESLSLEQRRQRVLGRMREVRTISPESLRRKIAALTSADVAVHDFTAPYTFTVNIYPQVSDPPDPPNYTAIMELIRREKPSHLRFILTVYETMESYIYFGSSIYEKYEVELDIEFPNPFDSTVYTGLSIFMFEKIIL